MKLQGFVLAAGLAFVLAMPAAIATDGTHTRVACSSHAEDSRFQCSAVAAGTANRASCASASREACAVAAQGASTAMANVIGAGATLGACPDDQCGGEVAHGHGDAVLIIQCLDPDADGVFEYNLLLEIHSSPL